MFLTIAKVKFSFDLCKIFQENRNKLCLISVSEVQYYQRSEESYEQDDYDLEGYGGPSK